MTIGDALLYSALGMIIVFFALFLIMLMTKILTIGEKENNAKEKCDITLNTSKEKAKGSAGEVKLYNTDPRDAAMIMAIVADDMGTPLNELTFISIKEVSK